MKNMKKILALSLVCCMCAGALVGCNKNSGSSSTTSGSSTEKKADNSDSGEAANAKDNTGDTVEVKGDASKGKVYWLNFKPEEAFDKTIKELAKTYKAKTGTDVKIVTAASGTYEQTLSGEMDKSEAPTMFVIGNAAGAKKWGEFALDLNNTKIGKELNTQTYNIHDADGKLVSIPYCYEAYGLIVNCDLLDKAGHKIDEIKDFASLKTVVEDIHKNKDKLGFDAFTSCDMDDSSSWRFTGHMVNLEYFYEEKKSGSQWTECPASLTGDYVQNYKNLFDLCINNSISDPKELATGGHDASQQFKDQKAAFTVQGSWEYAGYADAGLKNMKMIPYYCGVEGEDKAGLNCGTENCWAINANASEDDQAATMEFMYWLVTDKDASKQMVDALGIMPYNKAAESSNKFLKDAAEYDASGCYVMDWATNYQPNSDEYRKALVSALNSYCADQSDANWDGVKSAMIDGWATQYATANS